MSALCSNTLSAKALISLFLRLSSSISDLVSIAEPDEVRGFIGGEGRRADAEEAFDFIIVSPLQFGYQLGIGPQPARAAGVEQHRDAGHSAAAALATTLPPDELNRVGLRL